MVGTKWTWAKIAGLAFNENGALKTPWGVGKRGGVLESPRPAVAEALPQLAGLAGLLGRALQAPCCPGHRATHRATLPSRAGPIGRLRCGCQPRPKLSSAPAKAADFASFHTQVGCRAQAAKGTRAVRAAEGVPLGRLWRRGAPPELQRGPRIVRVQPRRRRRDCARRAGPLRAITN